MFSRLAAVMFMLIFTVAFSVQAFTHITVLSPLANDSVRVGDTLHIRFTADETVPSVTMQISFDQGFFYYDIDGKVFSKTNPSWGDYTWVIPETLTTIDMTQELINLYTVSNTVNILLVDQYNTAGESEHYPTPSFKILSRKPDAIEKAAHVLPISFQISPNPARYLCHIAGETGQITLTSLTGQRLLQQTFGDHHAMELNLKPFPAGVYIVSHQQNRETLSKRLIITR